MRFFEWVRRNSERYLLEEGVATRRFAYAAATDRHSSSDAKSIAASAWLQKVISASTLHSPDLRL